MSVNRHSKSCNTVVSKLDRHIKENYMSYIHPIRLAVIRGMAMKYEDLLSDNFKKKYSRGKKTAIDRYDQISIKLSKGKELTSQDNEFITDYVNEVTNIIKTFKDNDRLEKYLVEAGISSDSTIQQYKNFKNVIPAMYRRDITTQLVLYFMDVLDWLETNPKSSYYNSGKTRTEIIEDKGVDTIFKMCKGALKRVYADKGDTLTEEQKNIIGLLLNNNKAWVSSIFMTKNLLLDAERVKVGNDLVYVEDVQFDDIDVLNAFDSESNIESAEDEGPEHWMLKSDTISSFASMTKEVRSLLYKVTETTEKTGILGQAPLVDVMRLHETLQRVRKEYFCQTSEEFLDVLAYLSGSSEVYKQLYTLLKDGKPGLRTQFFNVYKTNELNYSYNTKKGFKKGNSTVGVQYYRERSSKKDNLIMSSYSSSVTSSVPEDCLFNNNGKLDPIKCQQFLLNIVGANRSHNPDPNMPYYVEGSNGNIVLNPDVIMREPEDNITSRESYEEWKNNPENAVKRVERRRAFINYINDSFNLRLKESDISTLMSNQYAFEKFSRAISNITQYLNIGTYDLKYLSGLFDATGSRLAMRDLVLSSKRSLSLLEKVTAIESKFRYNKSSYSIHTVPCFLGDSLERLGKAAKNGTQALKSYIEETYLNCPIYATKLEDGTYNIHNYWLRKLYNSTDQELADPNSFTNEFINGLVRGLGTADKAFEKFTEKDNLIYSLNEFFLNWVDSNRTLGATPLFVTGDSNSSRMIKTPILSKDEILDEMVTVAIQESERQQMFLDFIEFARANNLKLSNGHKGLTVEEWEKSSGPKPPIIENAHKFTLLRCLNDKDNYNKFIKAKEEYEAILDPIERENAYNEFRKSIKKIINSDLELGYKIFIAEGRRNKIFNFNSLRGTIELNSKELCIEGLYGNEDLSNKLIEAFYYNTRFNLMQQFQMFTVDPGFYNGTEDFQKRYKEMIASGNPLDLTALDPSNPNKLICPSGKQNVIYFNEETRDCITGPKYKKFRDMIMSLPSDRYSTDTKKRIIQKYSKNTLTDGQSYRTFTSYRSIMVMRGKWTSNMEDVYQKIMAVRREGRRLTEDEFKEIERKNVVFQPIKPFYFGFEKVLINGKEITVPVQHKYSEYVIIPELLPVGNKLGNLGLALEDAGIDLACCTTCIKVGGFGSTSMSDCVTKEDFDALFKSNDSKNPNLLGTPENSCYKHSLDLNGWREQSNIPEHVNSSRARGTQVIKHGLACLDLHEGSKSYDFIKKLGGRIKISNDSKDDIVLDSDKMNRLQLSMLYSALCSYGFVKSTLKTIKKLSTVKGISETLTNLRLNDTRSSSDGIEAYTIDSTIGDMLLSPCEGIGAVDNMAALLSLIRKDIIKQKFKGGSAVQVSAYGFDDDLEIHFDESGNPTIIDCAVAFDLDYCDGAGKRYKLEYLDFVDPETGYLLDENGNKVDKAIEDPSKTKLGKMFPGILDMIAYRIPTERSYSMLNLRVKKFLPKTAGGVIMVPSQLTTIAGFDFDIDKLYFLRKEFVVSTLKSIIDEDNPEEVYDIWTDYYKHDPFGKLIYRVATENLELNPTKLDPIHKHWDEVLNAIDSVTEIKQWPEFLAVDIRDIPKSSTDAFSEFAFPNSSNNYTFKRVKFISDYNPNIPMLNNNQAAVNNLIFDFLRERLMDPDTLEERIVPGGYATLKDAKPMMMCIRYGSSEIFDKILQSDNPFAVLKEYADSNFKDYSPEYDPTELSTITHYQNANALYDTLIGVAANQNINQRMTSLTEELYLVNPIIFGEASNDKDKRSQGLGRDVKTRFIAGRDTELLSTEFLASAVDAVKDALLEYFGIDLSNFNSACLLAKIGYGAYDIGLLFNQPVVIRTLERLKESSSKTNLIDAMYTTIQEEYLNDNADLSEYNKLIAELSKSIDGIDAYSLVTSRDQLVRYIAQDKKVLTELNSTDYRYFIRGQIGVIKLLADLQSASSEFAEAINMTKSSSVKSVPSALGGIQNIEQTAIIASSKFGNPKLGSLFKMSLATTDTRVTTILDPDLRINEHNASSILGLLSKTPFGLEQAAYSAIFTVVDSIISAYFPFRTKAYKNITQFLAGLTNKKLLSEDIFNALNKDIMVYCIERMTSLFSDNTPLVLIYPDEDGSPRKLPLTMLKKEFYSDSSELNFPSYFNEVINKNQATIKKLIKEGKNPLELGILDYSKIPLIAGIISQKFGKKRVLSFKGIGSLVKYQKDAIIDSFEFVLELAGKHNDPVLKDLGKHLFLYSFFNHGFNFSEGSIMPLVPFAFKLALGAEEALDVQDEREMYSVFFNRMFNLDTEVDDQGNTIIIERSTELGSRFSAKYLLQAFILNHPEFWQFTREVNYSSSKFSLYQKLNNIVSDNTTEDNILRPSFTIDLTSNEERNSSLSSLATIKYDKSGNMVSSTFIPVIIINGAIYMCNSDEIIGENGTLDGSSVAFNMSHPSRVGRMTYYRMNPTINSVDYSTPTIYLSSSNTSFQNDRESIQNMIGGLYRTDSNTSTTLDDSEYGANPQVVTERNPLLWSLASSLHNIEGLIRGSSLALKGLKLEEVDKYLENIRELINSIIMYSTNTKLTFNPENIESSEDPNSFYSIEGAREELAKLSSLIEINSNEYYTKEAKPGEMTIKAYIELAGNAIDRIEYLVSNNLEVRQSSKNSMAIEISEKQNLCE